jgi:ABC-type proline/glycine betaine transport system permease subunit
MAERIYLQRPGQDDVVAVATGFSWGALLLGFVWAMSKRMWFATFVMLGVSTILFLSGLWGDTIGTIGLVLSVLFGIACGVYGNQWHRWTLERRGYVVMRQTGESK